MSANTRQYYWEGIQGQHSVKNILSGFLDSDRKPQAIIISGLKGVGKDFLAIRFANLLNKHLHESHFVSGMDSMFGDDSTAEMSFQDPFFNSHDKLYIKLICALPTGKNESSDDKPLDKLSAADFKLVKEELEARNQNPYHRIQIPRANDIRINSIRDITRYFSTSMEPGVYRSVIISNAEQMNEAAQNALLKNLEEPPANSLFILTTSDAGALKETIRSRCWIIPAEPLKPEEIAHILRHYFDFDPMDAQEIAPFAGGSLDSALHLAEAGIEEIIQKTIVILRMSMGQKFATALTELEAFLKGEDRKNVAYLIRFMLYWLNDFERYRRGEKILYYQEHRDTFEKFFQRFHDINLLTVMDRLEYIDSLLQNNNANLNIALTNVILELASITNDVLKK